VREIASFLLLKIATTVMGVSGRGRLIRPPHKKDRWQRIILPIAFSEQLCYNYIYGKEFLWN
jgi:hypothetical protein